MGNCVFTRDAYNSATSSRGIDFSSHDSRKHHATAAGEEHVRDKPQRTCQNGQTRPGGRPENRTDSPLVAQIHAYPRREMAGQRWLPR